MNRRRDVEAAVAAAAEQLDPGDLRILADRIEQGWPREAILAAVPRPGFSRAAQDVLEAWLRPVPAIVPDARPSPEDAGPDGPAGAHTPAELAAYLRGLAAGYARGIDRVRVEPVWSGPRTLAVPIRATAHALIELVGEASRELTLMTYSAKPYPPLLDALSAAVARGVTVRAVVETLQGAGSALAGAEPAAAFAAVAGIELWHWPVGKRTGNDPAAVGEGGAKMHAKLAVADARALLVSSANLTQAGVSRNIEAGVLVRGGTAPRRVAEHIAELRAKGMLERLR